MKQQTAVEWLAKEINGVDTAVAYHYFKEKVKQAKEMEEQQKIDFARHCLNKAKDLDILSSFMNVEQYYNETFKSE